MLILERHSGETICINDDIKLTVYYHKGSQVKIAIDAPRDVRILREELLNSEKNELKQSENQPNHQDFSQSESNSSETIELNLNPTEKHERPQPIIKSRLKKRRILPLF